MIPPLWRAAVRVAQAVDASISQGAVPRMEPPVRTGRSSFDGRTLSATETTGNPTWSRRPLARRPCMRAGRSGLIALAGLEQWRAAIRARCCRLPHSSLRGGGLLVPLGLRLVRRHERRVRAGGCRASGGVRGARYEKAISASLSDRQLDRTARSRDGGNMSTARPPLRDSPVRGASVHPVPAREDRTLPAIVAVDRCWVGADGAFDKVGHAQRETRPEPTPCV